MYDRCAYYRVKLKGVPFKVRNRPLFDNKEQYLEYLKVCNAYRRYLKKKRDCLRKSRVPDPFYTVPKLGIFSNHGFRVLPLIETKYYLLACAGKLPIDTTRIKVSLEDFIVHLRLLGDTFNKSGTQLLKDLRGVTDEDYFRVLDSVFYKDVLVTYLYKVRKRLLIYLDKHQVYTISRQSHKLINKVDTVSDKYFTRQEREIINSSKEICLVRDRVQYYRGYRG